MEETLADVQHNLREQLIEYPTFDDFLPWFEAILADLKPDIVVGIARGAIRFLEMNSVSERKHGIRILSDHALPFLKDEEVRSKCLLLFDDSLIFGSTMDDCRSYLENRKALVHCAAYVVDRQHFFGEKKHPEDDSFPSVHRDKLKVFFKHKLWPSEIRIHHDVLVRRLLNTPGHYNLDFPTVSLSIRPYFKEDIAILMSIIGGVVHSDRVFELTSPDSALNEVFRYSVLVDVDGGRICDSSKVKFRPLTKLRLTFVPNDGLVRITPVVQILMHESVLDKGDIFSSEWIMRIWRSLRFPEQGDIYYRESMFRLLTSVISSLVAIPIVNGICKELSSRFRKPRVSMDGDDIKYVFGEENCATLLSLWGRQEADLPFETTLRTDGTKETQSVSVDANLLGRFDPFWNAYPQFKPSTGDVVYEMLSKVFLTLRYLTDSPAIRRATPGHKRLETGLSFEELSELLHDSCGIDLSADVLSFGVDACIDNGQAVPRILCRDSYFYRAFYSGERVESIDPMQLRNAFHAAYDEFLHMRGARPLDHFEVQKLTVTLKEVMKWLPISTKLSIFGRISMPVSVDQSIIDWLKSPGNPVLWEIADADLGRVLTVNATYHVGPHRAWDKDRTREFLDRFEMVALAFVKLGYGDKVFISSCLTYRLTYCAVAYEAYAWAIKGYYNFSTLVRSAWLDESGAIDSRQSLLYSIYWCARYFSEAVLKFTLFHSQFDSCAKRIGKVFSRQSFQAKHFWKFDLQPELKKEKVPSYLIDRFKQLVQIIEQMGTLTSYAVRVMIYNGVLSKQDVTEVFRQHSLEPSAAAMRFLFEKDVDDLSDEYNHRIASLQVPGPSLWTTNLPPLNRARTQTSYQEILKNLELCHDEAFKVLIEYIREYNTPEGSYIFAPDCEVRELLGGGVERVLPNRWLLTMDIIKGTHNEQTSEMKRICNQTFERFRDKNVYYEDTGNDAYIACASNAQLLLDIAESIRSEGERLKKEGSTFGGTRRALSYGSILLTEKLDGNFTIRDATIPNVIPAAFGLLDGSRQLDRVNVNSYIIVPKDLYDQLASVLARFLPSKIVLKVKSKHFKETVFAFDLTYSDDEEK